MFGRRLLLKRSLAAAFGAVAGLFTFKSARGESEAAYTHPNALDYLPTRTVIRDCSKYPALGVAITADCILEADPVGVDPVTGAAFIKDIRRLYSFDLFDAGLPEDRRWVDRNGNVFGPRAKQQINQAIKKLGSIPATGKTWLCPLCVLQPEVSHQEAPARVKFGTICPACVGAHQVHLNFVADKGEGSLSKLDPRVQKAVEHYRQERTKAEP